MCLYTIIFEATATIFIVVWFVEKSLIKVLVPAATIVILARQVRAIHEFRPLMALTVVRGINIILPKTFCWCKVITWVNDLFTY